jgi:hypothetical protein
LTKEIIFSVSHETIIFLGFGEASRSYAGLFAFL